jgi:hypothetical protein
MTNRKSVRKRFAVSHRRPGHGPTERCAGARKPLHRSGELGVDPAAELVLGCAVLGCREDGE